MANIKRANTSGITKSGVAIPDVPDAPTIGAATNVGTSRAYNNGSATVAFTGAATGGTSTSFTATSTPGGFTASGAGSPLTVTGLQSATSYTFAVTGTNASATGPASSASSSITATTVPATPSAPTATDSGSGRAYNNGAASVAFTAPATGGSAITGYTVISSPGGFTGTGSSSPITVTGQQSATAYTYTITATNANGTSTASSASASATATTVPQAPTIGTATDGGTGSTATVTYTAGATGGAAVSTFTATSSPGGVTGTGASPITVSGLTAGTAYTFTVTATNANGTSTASSASNSVTPAIPKAGFISDGAFAGGSGIDKLSFTSETISRLSAVTATNAQSGSGFSNNGVAGYIYHVNVSPRAYYKLAYATDSTSSIGNLSLGNGNGTNAVGIANSGTAGYNMGGGNQNSGITKLIFSNDTASIIATTLASSSYELAQGGRNGSTAAYYAGGSVGGYNTTISKIAFSNDARTTVATGLTVGNFDTTGYTSNSGTASYWGRGMNATTTFTSAIDKFVFSGETNSAIAATLSQARVSGQAVSFSGTAGYYTGGYISAGNQAQTTIDKLAYSGDTRSTLAAVLTNRRYSHPTVENT